MKNADVKMPVLFVGHGNPMNAIEDNEFSRAWVKAAKSLPDPKAILCISAHWESRRHVRYGYGASPYHPRFLWLSQVA